MSTWEDELKARIAHRDKVIALKDEIIAELQKQVEISDSMYKMLSDFHQLEAH